MPKRIALGNHSVKNQSKLFNECSEIARIRFYRRPESTGGWSVVEAVGINTRCCIKLSANGIGRKSPNLMKFEQSRCVRGAVNRAGVSEEQTKSFLFDA